MRKIEFNVDHSGEDFSNQKVTGYHNGCKFRNCKFVTSELDLVAVNCTFDRSDFSFVRYKRFYTPGSTFVDVTFKKPLTHVVAHKVMGTFSPTYNHQIIAEIIRRHADRTANAKLKQIVYQGAQVVFDRKDLSYNDFILMLPKRFWLEAEKAFENHPDILRKIMEVRKQRWT